MCKGDISLTMLPLLNAHDYIISSTRERLQFKIQAGICVREIHVQRIDR